MLWLVVLEEFCTLLEVLVQGPLSRGGGGAVGVSLVVFLGRGCCGVVGAEVVIAVAFVAVFARWCSWGRGFLLSGR